MTPKEKAEEIYTKQCSICPLEGVAWYKRSKQLALIEVDEMKKEAIGLSYGRKERIKWLNEVEKEIKLI